MNRMQSSGERAGGRGRERRRAEQGSNKENAEANGNEMANEEGGDVTGTGKRGRT